jgi:hypothetical protein
MRFNFFVERTRGYERPNKAVSLQKIDIGIAMCHFELAAVSLRNNGKWNLRDDVSGRGTWEYIVSWEDSGTEKAEIHNAYASTTRA